MYKKNNIIKEKSYNFALLIIKVYKRLVEEKKEFVLSKQLLKSGTSIGANIEEAIGAQSKKDFLSKINIAYKEARESGYWIKLLRDSNYIGPKLAKQLLDHCEEINKILAKIIITTKSSILNS